MQIKTIAIAAAAGGALLWAGTLITKTEPIETKLASATEIILADAGFEGLRIEYSGRDAHIYGGAEFANREAEIRRRVMDIWGVRVARTHFGDEHANASQSSEGDSQQNTGKASTDSTTIAAADTEALSEQALDALEKAHFQQLAVALEGSTATVSGPSPGILEEEQALKIVGAIKGINTVKGDFSSASGKAITAEEKATAKACALAINSTLATGRIEFASGSAKLNPSSFALLNQLAAETLKCADAVIQINGHTDSSGSDEINQPLSAERAAAVAKYLAGEGLAAKRLKTNGFGASRPLTSNETEEGRARNRRIEFRVIL